MNSVFYVKRPWTTVIKTKVDYTYFNHCGPEHSVENVLHMSGLFSLDSYILFVSLTLLNLK